MHFEYMGPTTQKFKTDNGLPLVSVLYPVLFCLLLIGIFTSVESEKIKFVDDVTI